MTHTRIRSIHADDPMARVKAAVLLRNGFIQGIRPIRVRASTARAMRAANVPNPSAYPNRPGLNLDANSIVISVSVRRPRSCVCSVAFLLRKGEVQMKYLKRSSNSASSESEAEDENVCCDPDIGGLGKNNKDGKR